MIKYQVQTGTMLSFYRNGQKPALFLRCADAMVGAGQLEFFLGPLFSVRVRIESRMATFSINTRTPSPYVWHLSPCTKD